MALQKNELFTAPEIFSPIGRYHFTNQEPRTFSPVLTAKTLLRLTPVGYRTDTGKWVEWDAAGVNGEDVIKGFVADPEELSTTEDVLVTIGLGGEISRHDIINPATGTPQSAANNAALDTALRTGMRAFGFTIRDLEGVN
jgi:hypothetical protein